VKYQRVDLHGSGIGAHARILARARERLRASPAPTRLVVAHRALLPVASMLAAAGPVRGVSVVCYGSDVWGNRHRGRRVVETHLMRRSGVRIVAISSYTAGALGRGRPAAILPPGLSHEWFRTLVDASTTAREREPGIQLVSAFRLADWRAKGLPELLTAVAALDRPDVRVTVCGTGLPPRELEQLVLAHPCCILRPGLTNRELARELAGADLFVLATRTKRGRHACGEGFGLVLLEAQVAGTPVIGPAYGGSHEAYLERVTGATPADETAESLAEALAEMLRDPQRMAQMGRRAAEWARESFAPEQYAARAVANLL
jgi:glycosyltransferase involved in cell wall biosynthesis